MENNKNIIASDISLLEIINGLNNGILFYSEIKNVRIINKLKPEYIIIAVEADITEDIINYIDSDPDFKKYKIHQIETTVLDFTVLTKDVAIDGKTLKLSSMSLFELISLTKEIDNFDKEWDIEGLHYECFEINYVEPVMEIVTDMT